MVIIGIILMALGLFGIAPAIMTFGDIGLSFAYGAVISFLTGLGLVLVGRE